MFRHAECAASGPRRISLAALAGFVVLAAFAWLASLATAQAQGASEPIEAFAPPAGWQQAEFHGYRFAVPGDWKKVEDRDDGLIFFGGDMATRTGPSFGMGLSRQDKLLPKGVEIADERTVRIGASDFRRIVFTTKMDASTTSNTALYVSPQPVEGDRYLVIFNMALNDELAAHEALYRQMLGTVVAPAASAGPAAVAEMRGKAGQAAAPAQGVRVEVAGVTFTLPQGWTATTDKRDEKILKSPDGRFTVLAFWWFPDEPLTAYDDVYNVEQAVIDHEPVTRIYSDFGTRNSIQNVTERARADKDRFIFTLEGEGVSREEVKALHDRIVPTVRYAAGFSGKRPDAGGAGKAMPQDEAGDVAMQAAPTETSPTETAPAGAAPMPGNRTVDFSSGDIAGWSGEVADLSVRSGGPNGGAYMDAFTPGDGRTGYVHAPQSLLGDWRGYAGMRIVLQTGQGQFVPPYEYGGRGDVVIANGSMTASLVFPAPVQAGWHEQQISFAGGAWKLAGAQSLDQVLANVTDFAIRAEYRMGDANAGFASIEWIAGGGAAMASADAAADVDAQPAADAPPEEGNRWATYRNARFGTEVQYPAYLFSLVQESANGDGATFQSANGELKFIVFGQYNYDGFNIRGLAERDAASDRFDEVTYRKTGKDWYVLSGYIGGDIFYRRAVLDPNGVVHVLEITYPRSEKEQMDVVVTQMANTLVP